MLASAKYLSVTLFGIALKNAREWRPSSRWHQVILCLLHIVGICSTFATLNSPVAQMLIDARAFAGVPHAGTADDPWPGSAIGAATASLPDASGATVVLAPGIWRVDGLVAINKSGFTLSGSNRAATIEFHDHGQLLLSSPSFYTTALNSVNLKDLRFDASALASGAREPLHLRNCVRCTLTNNYIGPRPDLGYISVVLFEGGMSNIIKNNDFVANYLQINALGFTPNSDFLVTENRIDSGGMLFIGISRLTVSKNLLTNESLGNYIGIRVAAPYGGSAQGINIQYNTLDATRIRGKENGVLISGLPQDSGGKGTLRSFHVRWNKLRGTSADINAQVGAHNYMANECMLTCREIPDTYDVQIYQNKAEALWGGVFLDVRGGTYGVVDGGRVDGNRLTTYWPGAIHHVLLDSHTRNVKIGRNPSAQQVLVEKK